MEYLVPVKNKRKATLLNIQGRHNSGLQFSNMQHHVQSQVARDFNEAMKGKGLLSTNDALLAKLGMAHQLDNYVKSANIKKQPLTVYDKVFYYYTLQTPLTMYAHKAFILLEMQLNATLVRAKLVPYLFLVRDLCFYRLVQLNTTVAKNPYQVVSLYDSVSVPVYLHNYMYYRQYRIQYYSRQISSFFKKY